MLFELNLQGKLPSVSYQTQSRLHASFPLDNIGLPKIGR